MTAAASAAFQSVAAFVQARSGLALGPDKLYLVEARLGPIIKREKLGDLAGLAASLARNPPAALAEAVVEAMTTNESFFFRDDKPFRHFQNAALPRLLAARAAGAPLRIWSAAASSGQEAYSLAMILAETGLAPGRRVEIIATDIAREQLARARAGLYTQFEVQRGLPVRLLLKYFRKEGDGAWRIVDAIRQAVVFREWNLLADPAPLGVFDIVFCRNVLIYFDRPTKQRVLAAIARQLAPDGLLYLGGSETVLGISTDLAPCPGEAGIYTQAVAAGQVTMQAGSV